MLKIGSVDIIECVIQSEVRTHDLHRDDVVHGQSRGLNGRLYTIHDELRFNPWVFRSPVSLRIYTNMTGNIKGVTNKHSVAKWQRRARSAARSIYKLSICVRTSLAGTEGKEQGKRDRSYRHFFLPTKVHTRIGQYNLGAGCAGPKRLRIPKALNVRFRAAISSASIASVGRHAPAATRRPSRPGLDRPGSPPKECSEYMA